MNNEKLIEKQKHLREMTDKFQKEHDETDNMFLKSNLICMLIFLREMQDLLDILIEHFKNKII